MPRELNPFVFDRPVAPNDLIDRVRELQQLADLARTGQTTRLTAPRRYGKTTLLGAAAATLAEQGMTTVYADFSRTRTLHDVVIRLEAAWARALAQRRGTKRLWRSVRYRLGARLELGVPGVARASLTLSPAPRGHLLEALHELLALPDKVADATGPLFVTFDEFPELLTADDDLDGIVRSHVQHHAGVASYCFAGSQASAMRALFEDRRRPLFAQARQLDLGPIPSDALGAWIAERFSAHERTLAPRVLEGVLRLAAGHPQRAMLLAHFLWEQPQLDERAVGAARDAAVGEASGEIEQVWRGLTRSQRRALATAAAGHAHLLGPAAVQASGSAKPTMQKARRALLTEGHLRQRLSGGVELTDPLFPIWLSGAEPVV